VGSGFFSTCPSLLFFILPFSFRNLYLLGFVQPGLLPTELAMTIAGTGKRAISPLLAIIMVDD
jgi:hypothetical protein